jgi:carboxypeptidase family protein
MNRRVLAQWVLVTAVCVLGAPAAALAQSVITGVVRDSSGGVLPGVSVEASSPALIENVRTGVTDGEGQYRIIDLRAGTYVVTFSLAGFGTVKQQGLELPALFTATVNAVMRVAELSETVTVKGGAPLVDVQSVAAQTVLTQKMLEEIPTGRSIWGNSQVIPGVTARRQGNGPRDVGGTQGHNQSNVTAHGSADADGSQLLDGMRINGITGDGGDKTYINPGGLAEFSYATGGIDADVSGGGVRLNMIPKDGGNDFHGSVFSSWTNKSFQSEPLTDDLRSAGLASADAVSKLYDLTLGAGGPIKEQRMWFYGSYRRYVADLPVTNSFYTDASAPTLNTWTPDLSRPVTQNNLITNYTGRVLLQVNRLNKLAGYYDKPIKVRINEQIGSGALRARESFFHRGGFSREETGGIDQTGGSYQIWQLKWTGAWTDRLLFEAGFQRNNQSPPVGHVLPDLAVDISKGIIPVPKFDLITQTRWGAPSTDIFLQTTTRQTIMTALSYVTGSHAFKVGIEGGSGNKRLQRYFDQPGVNFVQQYSNGVPTSLVLYNTPVDQRNDMQYDLGIYLQDRWTVHRLTVSPGIRFEAIRVGWPEQGTPLADQSLLLLEGYQPRPVFAARDNIPNWKNWSPRLGVAYDLFGDAKTVVKLNIDRYQAAQSVGLAERYNPLRGQTETRTWNDVNRNFMYDPGVDILGPTSNLNFGAAVFRTPDPDLRRPYNTELGIGIRREIRSGMAAGFSYYRRSFGNLEYSENALLANAPGAFTPIVVQNPCLSNPQWNCPGTILPTVTIYSINPALQGLGTVVDRNSANNTRVYNGFEGDFSIRTNRTNIFGGLTVDRTVSNSCEPFAAAFADASNPNAALLCDESAFNIPFRPQVKVGGSYELPYAFRLSGTFQSNPSPFSNVTFLFTRQATPGLTQASVNGTLIEPGSFALPRHNQLDVRLARAFKFAERSVELQVDLFNALNARTPDALTTAAGPTLGRPTQVLQPRFVAFGAQFHF